MKDVAIAVVLVLGLVTFSYLRRGQVCLAPGLVLAVVLPLVIVVFEWRLHAVVWQDAWKRFARPPDPVDKVIEGMLGEAGIAFERLGPWQAFRSFKYRFSERYLLADGTRLSVRGEDEPVVYVGPASMVDEVERLRGLVERTLG